MYAEFEQDPLQFQATNAFRYDTVIASDPTTVIHSQTEPRIQHTVVTGSTPQAYRSPGLTKPDPASVPAGLRLIKVTPLNAFGAGPTNASDPYPANPPGPVSNIRVIDPQL